jgi:SHS2 domain-containing protein
MMKCEYEELDHTAEVGMRVRAATPAELFACVATALFQLIGTQPADHSAQHTLTVESFDAESLLVDWLNELLYLHEKTGEVYDTCAVGAWTTTRLEAMITGGQPLHPPLRAIKAVTYHGLQLSADATGWTADVYVDV